jgi:hypothetical protein
MTTTKLPEKKTGSWLTAPPGQRCGFRDGRSRVTVTDQRTRPILIRRGLALEWATLGWNAAGIIILAFAAVAARSVALAGFGLDSLIEIGLILNAAAGWWWADPAAGYVLVYYAAREVRDIFTSHH